MCRQKMVGFRGGGAAFMPVGSPEGRAIVAAARGEVVPAPAPAPAMPRRTKPRERPRAPGRRVVERKAGEEAGVAAASGDSLCLNWRRRSFEHAFFSGLPSPVRRASRRLSLTVESAEGISVGPVRRRRTPSTDCCCALQRLGLAICELDPLTR